MVGFSKHDNISTTEKFFAGCLTGVITRFLTQPLDILKLRTQLQKKNRSLYQTFKLILREEGSRAFFHGHVLGQVHSVLSVATQFYVYELTTKYAASLHLLPKEYKPISNTVCGLLSGAATSTIVMPLEVIRIRQMLVKDQYGGLVKGAKAVYRYGGFFAFYEGLSAGILQMGPQVAISFLVFSTVQPYIIKLMEAHCEDTNRVPNCKNRPESVIVSSTIAGSAAGFLSKSATYPLDLSKRRLQIGTHRHSEEYKVPKTAKKLIKCTSLLDCLRVTYQKEGLKGLFRGWKVTVYKAQITSIVAFTIYEFLCHTLRLYKYNKANGDNNVKEGNVGNNNNEDNNSSERNKAIEGYKGNKDIEGNNAIECNEFAK